MERVLTLKGNHVLTARTHEKSNGLQFILLGDESLASRMMQGIVQEHGLILLPPLAENFLVEKQDLKESSQGDNFEVQDFKKSIKSLTKKQLNDLLVRTHYQFSHLGFRYCAKMLGIPLPNPPPSCVWCYLTNPRQGSVDKVSMLNATRVNQIFSADFVGPFRARTPEGCVGAFIICEWMLKVFWVFGVRARLSGVTFGRILLLWLRLKVEKKDALLFSIVMEQKHSLTALCARILMRKGAFNILFPEEIHNGEIKLKAV